MQSIKTNLTLTNYYPRSKTQPEDKPKLLDQNNLNWFKSQRQANSATSSPKSLQQFAKIAIPSPKSQSELSDATSDFENEIDIMADNAHQIDNLIKELFSEELIKIMANDLTIVTIMDLSQSREEVLSKLSDQLNLYGVAHKKEYLWKMFIDRESRTQDPDKRSYGPSMFDNDPKDGQEYLKCLYITFSEILEQRPLLSDFNMLIKLHTMLIDNPLGQELSTPGNLEYAIPFNMEPENYLFINKFVAKQKIIDNPPLIQKTYHQIHFTS